MISKKEKFGMKLSRGWKLHGKQKTQQNQSHGHSKVGSSTKIPISGAIKYISSVNVKDSEKDTVKALVSISFTVIVLEVGSETKSLLSTEIYEKQGDGTYFSTTLASNSRRIRDGEVDLGSFIPDRLMCQDDEGGLNVPLFDIMVSGDKPGANRRSGLIKVQSEMFSDNLVRIYRIRK